MKRRFPFTAGSGFFEYVGAQERPFWCSFLCCFFVWFFFIVFWSFWGAKMELFWSSKSIKMRLVSFWFLLIFYWFLQCFVKITVLDIDRSEKHTRTHRHTQAHTSHTHRRAQAHTKWTKKTWPSCERKATFEDAFRYVKRWVRIF